MPYLEMTGISRIYSNNLVANNAIDLSVEKNEIHAIIGENGAGKTTLMKILAGEEQPDAGSIWLEGRRVTLRGPLHAGRLGIGMVHQHFKLIPEFTVAENVILGHEPVRAGFLVDTATAVRRIAAVIESHGFSIDPRARVGSLTMGQQQQVEIVRVLSRDARLLILDEPTSVLTEQETHRLFDTLRSLRAAGKTIIIITHKLQEVKEISERVTVMRRGSVVAVKVTAAVAKAELSRLMVGRSVLFQVDRRHDPCGPAVLELQKVSLRQPRRGRPLLDHVDLTVRSCQVVGVAAVSGNGRGELEDVVTRLRRISGGRIFHRGEEVSHLAPSALRERGLAYVPADRLGRGSSLHSSVTENLIITARRRFLRAGFLDRGRMQRFAEEQVRSFAIDGSPETPVGRLSGGNIQKVILARELAHQADLVVVSEPTWGLDVESSQFVYEKILALRAAGAGILLLSSNLDELVGLADTIVVLYRGRVVAELANEHEAPRQLKERIGEYMLGLRDDFAPGLRPEPAAAGPVA
jgi:general nucleoside transport system ATP-binding protein